MREALLGAAAQYEQALAVKPLDLSTLFNYGTVLFDLARCPPAPPPQELPAIDTTDAKLEAELNALELEYAERVAALKAEFAERKAALLAARQ